VLPGLADLPELAGELRITHGAGHLGAEPPVVARFRRDHDEVRDPGIDQET
jgi:hypothetical protein